MQALWAILGNYGIFCIWLPFVAIHVIFAFGVYWDARYLREVKTGLFLFWPIMWAAIALSFGLFGLVAYWLIHHSTLRPLPPVAVNGLE